MADKSSRLPQNAAGPFYVDSTCIDCDLCRNEAPEFFHRDDELGSTVVYRQPVNSEEWARAQAGLESCPTDSIGNDGTTFDPSLPMNNDRT